MATIIAIGGEEIGGLRADGSLKPIITEAIHKEILTQTNKKHPKILYIPTAKDDSEAFIAGFKKYYTDLGAQEVTVLRLIRERPSKQEIETKIFSADAIYINGGNSYRMLRIWKRYGIDKLLEKAYHQGIVLSGHSAGAICWFKYGCSDAFYKKQPFRLTAMGFINALLCPHYDSEPVRQTALKKMMKRTFGLVAITLDECAAIEIIDGKYRILGANPTDKARRAFWKNGHYVLSEIPKSTILRDLDELLTKP